MDQRVTSTATAPITVIGHLRAAIKFLILMAWLVAMLVPFLILEGLKMRASAKIVKLWHQGAGKITGIRVTKIGTVSQTLPLLMLGNHTSYLDIPVLNAMFTVNFIAKSDVRGWPGIGFLARCCQTIFVERRAIKSREQIRVLREKILPDRRLVLFAEGTSTDGSVVLPFKSSLLEFVFDDQIGAQCSVQPVTILCLKHRSAGAGSGVAGGAGAAGAAGAIPATSAASATSAVSVTGQEPQPERVLYPWFDDTPLATHFWRFLASPGADVHVHFSPARPVLDFDNRKELTRWAQGCVQDGYRQILKSA